MHASGEKAGSIAGFTCFSERSERRFTIADAPFVIGVSGEMRINSKPLLLSVPVTSALSVLSVDGLKRSDRARPARA